MRDNIAFKVIDAKRFKRQMLNWCRQKPVFALLDSNGYNKIAGASALYSEFDFLAAVNALDIISCKYGNALNKLNECITTEKDWYFGLLGYDLKNEIENLTSENTDQLGFDDLYFFRPELIFILKNNRLEIHYHENDFNEKEIIKTFGEIIDMPPFSEHQRWNINIRQRIKKDEYLSKINHIQKHIYRGDIYEMNFCQEFYAEDMPVDPVILYANLVRISPAPFSCLYRFNDKYLISSSPERYLKKKGSRILSQPMKGTIKRNNDLLLDQSLKERLRRDPKENSENVMIVDLVRNDLAKTAVKSSVQVEELCGIYSYPTVHQMVSTISSELRSGCTIIDLIRSTFPMGSMTGAPKIRAMQIIEQYEETKRGIYSGAAGYITPEMDFDFNVVIRSILYNQTNHYLSFITGGAITANSVPENEYEECFLKAKALVNAIV
ncbi:MAG: anthranilate synthase component I family protein [Bacteroidales bacterium]|nr:anthranilate synthase component I family protein [Bacteroidales bacterium]